MRKYILAFILGLLFQEFGSIHTNHCSSKNGGKSSSIGQEFIFGILEAIASSFRGTVALDIVSVDTGTLTLEITYLGVNTHYNISPGSNVHIPIDVSIQEDGTFQGQRGIRITSDIDISVLVTNYYSSSSTESYLIYPVQTLSTHYIVSSYTSFDYGEYGSRAIVIAVEDKTHVFIGRDTIGNITLNSMEVYQVEVPYPGDLTGTVIRSNKPVTVISGSALSEIPDQVKDGDHIASQMLPINTWQKAYIVPLTGLKAFMIRVLSESLSTNVTLKNKTNTIVEVVQPSDKKDYFFGSEVVVVTADAPFSVTQYLVGQNYDNVDGDPFMTVVPAVSQFIHNYTFMVPSPAVGFIHHLALIVPTDQVAGIRLDGSPVSGTTVGVPAPYSNYSVLTLTVNEGYHTMIHQNVTVKFGLLVYGFKSKFGYGYYAGMDLQGTCDGSSTASTTSSTSTSTSSTTKRPSTSTATVQPTRVTATMVTNSTVSGLRNFCYSCEDMSHLQYCDRIHACQENEVCFVGRFNKDGSAIYRSGCMNHESCSLQHKESLASSNECVECCNSSFCNGEGCGDHGLPDRSERGPLCFDCGHVGNIDECHTVTVCQDDELCSIEEYNWGHTVHYKLGCASKLCYPIKRSILHPSVRSSPVCHSCCDTDHCNNNCTGSGSSVVGNIIVG